MFVHFDTEKCKIALFDRFNKSIAIDVRRMGLFQRKKLSFKILGYLSRLNWIGALTWTLQKKQKP